MNIENREILTLISRDKQRWRFMSLLRSFGRFRTRFSSSTPLVSCHLYCSYLLIRSRRLSGSKRWDIHCSASLLLTLISSNLVVVDCKYVCFKQVKMRNAESFITGFVTCKACMQCIRRMLLFFSFSLYENIFIVHILICKTIWCSYK